MTLPPSRARGSTSPPTATDPLLTATGVSRRYRRGGRTVTAIDEVDLRLGSGETVALLGRSGAGKTTLLALLGALERPDAGSIVLAGDELTTLDDEQLAEVRRDRTGFVFQDFGLLGSLTATENVGVPLRLRRADPAERDDRVAQALAAVGLAERGDHLPHQLSGGEQQRVAIARAMADEPALVLADEPTGQLDSGTGGLVIDLLVGLASDRGATVVIATHDPAVTRVADRVLELEGGRLGRE